MTSIVLRLAVEDPELRNFYLPQINAHNDAIINTSHPNSGFDLYVPHTHVFAPNIHTSKINFGVKTEMLMIDLNGGITPCAFYLMPRSSLSNTPLMLSNHVGVVDSGYRGDIIGAFRNLSNNEFIAEERTRLLQICHPSLIPFRVDLVSSVNDLSTTSRGSGGFGSTGR
jgi:dUTP pyrophosphatase